MENEKEQLIEAVKRLSVRLNNKNVVLDKFSCEKCMDLCKKANGTHMMCDEHFSKFKRIKRNYHEEWFAICEIVRQYDELDQESFGTPYQFEISFQDKIRDIESVLDGIIPKKDLEELQNQRNRINRKIATLKKANLKD